LHHLLRLDKSRATSSADESQWTFGGGDKIAAIRISQGESISPADRINLEPGA
jgi:hypothetical protein